MKKGGNKFRRIGLVGGVSWASSAEYYRRFNIVMEDSDELGIVLVDLNFKHIREAQDMDLVDKEMQLVGDGVRRAVNAGGEVILVCSNTTSRTLHYIKRRSNVKIVSLIDCVSDHLDRGQFKETLLLGTRYTMERDFYRSAMQNDNRIIHIPDCRDRVKIHQIIYEELCRGEISGGSKKWFGDMLECYITKFPNLDSIILGCTELSLLGINKIISRCAVIDTISVHVECALRLASVEHNPHRNEAKVGQP
ncbi:aspartate/glutamate racemase family protein [Mesorhizobium escarrei]|uniref:L-aspartate/glutamate-specific racemase n=1 Tax=Mesorhizobium escarrei TaxID=666018 RepID=A0ABM9E7A8_9HYPH|nr:amino acid racemase [Mesorhizobium escarrei]CAH2405018.1 putative L-aspartate/glutamate-specific racemase [Mesorhizobium escarrei]